ncbi:MAG TPA: hypothetical protein V6D19_19890 [Stenomitos sp.]
MKVSPSSSATAVLIDPADERTVKTVRQHYQTSHQEEFMRLKAQVESLLVELQSIGTDQSSENVESA